MGMHFESSGKATDRAYCTYSTRFAAVELSVFIQIGSGLNQSYLIAICGRPHSNKKVLFCYAERPNPVSMIISSELSAMRHTRGSFFRDFGGLCFTVDIL
jgi:hypothetical protein